MHPTWKALPLGFDRPLYVLPFDHRGSFQTRMFGWEGRLTSEQAGEVAAAKRVIYDGFTAALAAGVSKDEAAERSRRGGLHHPGPRRGCQAGARLAEGGRRSPGIHRLRRGPDGVLGAARCLAGPEDDARGGSG